MRRLLLLSAAVAVLAAVGVGTAVAVAGGDSEPTIDGVHFTSAEVASAQERAERDGRDADDPSAAVEVLRDDVALFAVARQVGATDVVRPSDITGVLVDVNRQRAADAEAGEVLYGPVEYDERSFYGKALTDIRQAVLARLDDGAADTTITDEDVRTRFDVEPGAWADAATTYHLDAVTGSGALPGASDWAALTVSGIPQERDYTTEDLAAGAVGPEVVAALGSAQVGDVIGPFPEGGGWTALRLESRSVDTEAAFDHYRTRIRAALLDERLARLVSDARAAQVVQLP